MNDITLKIYGYCNKNIQELRKYVIRNRLAEIIKEKGEFVVIAESVDKTVIVTSGSGVVPYYYFYDGKTLFHGNTVAAICAQAKLSWCWNFRALGDYVALDHTLDEDTLHPLIKRTPPRSIISINSYKLNISKLDDSPTEIRQSQPNNLIDELSQEVLQWWRPSGCVLSMSGGLDSRLILATLLAAGKRPTLLVCGQDTAFDLMVAREISAHLKLDLIRTEVCSADLLDAASSISRETNGLLPVTHWPGVLFAKKNTGELLFTGLNGEIARSYYDDNGLLSFMRSFINPLGRHTQKFWANKFYGAFAEKDYDEIHPELAQQFLIDAQICRVSRLMGKGYKFSHALDRAFSLQYGRHKTGADVAGLSLMTRWIGPFCSPSWSNLAKYLSPEWKLGSAFHRYAIDKLVPELLLFPEENNPYGTTTNSPSIRYWMGLQSKPKVTPFFDQSLYENPALVDLIYRSLFCLDDIISPKLLRLIAASPQRRRLFFQLGAVALWRQELGIENYSRYFPRAFEMDNDTL